MIAKIVKWLIIIGIVIVIAYFGVGFVLNIIMGLLENLKAGSVFIPLTAAGFLQNKKRRQGDSDDERNRRK